MNSRHVLLLFVTLHLVACAAAHYDDPVKTMSSRASDPSWRIAAAKQAAAEHSSDPKFVAALNDIAWDHRGNPDELRIFAIDQLIAMDEKDFVDKLERRIVLIPYGKPLEHIYVTGKARKWPQLTPILVKRWAMPQFGVADKDRVERKWLIELNPGKDLEAVVFEVFTGPEEKITPPQRVGAWALLNRIATKEKLIESLAKAPDSAALIVDLKACAADLHTMPRHREGVLWMQYLREPARAAWWRGAKENVAKMPADRRVDLEMRHLALLPLIDAQTMAKDRVALFAELSEQLRGERRYLTAEPPLGEYPQGLHDYHDKFSWADLATIKVLFKLVREPDVKAALFAQGDKDVKDEGTEHGGVLDIIDGKPTAKKYLPMLRISHNRQFTPSEEMIRHCYTALAHYHFHAQEYKNSLYAGPGQGDLQTADRLDFNFLVFTFIDENRMNADYYQPGGVVVDLGVIQR